MTAYYLDTQSGEIYFAVAVLTNIEPDKPPLVVRVADIFAEGRFVSVSDATVD